MNIKLKTTLKLQNHFRKWEYFLFRLGKIYELVIAVVMHKLVLSFMDFSLSLFVAIGEDISCLHNYEHVVDSYVDRSRWSLLYD